MEPIQTYEHVIREHDAQLFDIVQRYLSYIPDFTGLASRSTLSHAERVYGTLYTELSNVGVARYAKIVAALEIKRVMFHLLPREICIEFIESFPTLIWALLLQKRRYSTTFRLLIASGRLGFIEEGVARVVTARFSENDSRTSEDIAKFAKNLVMPFRLGPTMIAELTTVADAMTLRAMFPILLRGPTQWKPSMLRHSARCANSSGHMYYIASLVEEPTSITILDWKHILTKYKHYQHISENVVCYYFEQSIMTSMNQWNWWINVAMMHDWCILLTKVLELRSEDNMTAKIFYHTTSSKILIDYIFNYWNTYSNNKMTVHSLLESMKLTVAHDDTSNDIIILIINSILSVESTPTVLQQILTYTISYENNYKNILNIFNHPGIVSLLRADTTGSLYDNIIRMDASSFNNSLNICLELVHICVNLGVPYRISQALCHYYKNIKNYDNDIIRSIVVCDSNLEKRLLLITTILREAPIAPITDVIISNNTYESSLSLLNSAMKYEHESIIRAILQRKNPSPGWINDVSRYLLITKFSKYIKDILRSLITEVYYKSLE